MGARRANSRSSASTSGPAGVHGTPWSWAPNARKTCIAREYARRRTLLLEALRRRLGHDVTWTEPQGGFSLLMTLPDGMSANALLPRALQRGVGFTPGTAFFLDESGERTLRLSFSSVPSARIDDGVRRLAEAIKDMRRQPRPRRAERAGVPVV